MKLKLENSKTMEERREKALNLIKQNQKLTLNLNDLSGVEVKEISTETAPNPAGAGNVPHYNQNLKDKKLNKENTKEKTKIILPDLPVLPKNQVIKSGIADFVADWLKLKNQNWIQPQINNKKIFIDYQNMNLYFRNENNFKIDLYGYLLENFFNSLKNILYQFHHWLYQETLKEFNDPMTTLSILHYDNNLFVNGIEFMGSECFKKYFLKFLQTKKFIKPDFLFELFKRFISSCYKLKSQNSNLKFAKIPKLQNDLWNFFIDTELDIVFVKIENFTNELKELDPTYLQHKERQERLNQVKELKDK